MRWIYKKNTFIDENNATHRITPDFFDILKGTNQKFGWESELYDKMSL